MFKKTKCPNHFPIFMVKGESVSQGEGGLGGTTILQDQEGPPADSTIMERWGWSWKGSCNFPRFFKHPWGLTWSYGLRRPNNLIPLMVPWTDECMEDSEKKASKLNLLDLIQQSWDKGWQISLFPIESRSRGFPVQSLGHRLQLWG